MEQHDHRFLQKAFNHLNLNIKNLSLKYCVYADLTSEKVRFSPVLCIKYIEDVAIK